MVVTTIDNTVLPSSGTVTLSADLLTASLASSSGSTYVSVKSTNPKLKGKWFFETTSIENLHTSAQTLTIGIQEVNSVNVNYYASFSNLFYGFQGTTNTVTTGAKRYNINGDFSETGYGINLAVGKTVGVLADLDNGKLTFYVNGVNCGVAYACIDTSLQYVVVLSNSGGSSRMTAEMNFGAKPFKYLPTDLPRGTRSYNGDLLTDYMAVSNGSEKFSLSENTLTTLPSTSSKSMILFGIEKNKEVQLDTSFSKKNYITENEIALTNGKIISAKVTKSNKLDFKVVK